MLWSLVGLSVGGLARPGEAMAAGNDAILKALKDKDKGDEVERGEVTARLRSSLEELRRAQTLASVG